ncbi:MAG: ion transporter [Marinicaulis sp.]|nr:ion transporter [Marinicaulis sp.]NNL89398.1 ion transporter [Marinicaulis sp.]
MASAREKTENLIESRGFQGGVLILIILNAILLGAETFPKIKADYGEFISTIDRLIIYAFLFEIGLRIFAERENYFKKGWNVFDFTIVMVSLLAATSGFAALRAFRVLRVLRLITVIPRMRVVVSALLDSIPGIASVGVVLALIIYVFAVIAATLYGPEHPELFRDVFASMYTLFQVMTLEGWPDIAAEVRATHPNSWVFFMTFVLIATFTVLNLFVAIVVRVVEEDSNEILDSVAESQKSVEGELAAIRAEITKLSKRLPDK